LPLIQVFVWLFAKISIISLLNNFQKLQAMQNIPTNSMINFPVQRKKIYLIRHGETEFNKMGLVQGSGVDAVLNETGWQQAECFYNAYKQVKFDKVYTSALRRTHQTVHLFLKNGLAWETLKGLNEISWGNKEGKPLTIQDDTKHFAMLEGWRNGELHLKPEGGESPLDVQLRQKRALAQIMSQPQEQNILICMHGRAMKIFLSLLLNTDLSLMDSYEHSNLSLYVLDYENHLFSLKVRDDRQHLNPLPQPQQASKLIGLRALPSIAV
jgi:broad specificity phosphatase PhoE